MKKKVFMFVKKKREEIGITRQGEGIVKEKKY